MITSIFLSFDPVLLDFLTFFNALTGLKEDNINAGYNPDNNAVTRIKIPRLAKNFKSVKLRLNSDCTDRLKSGINSSTIIIARKTEIMESRNVSVRN